MGSPSELLDHVAALHEDAFSWAVTCCGGDEELGADALQEAYVKLASGRAVFSGRSSLKTWWLAVIRFTAIEQQRGQQRWRRLAESFRDWLAMRSEDRVETGAAGQMMALDAEQLAVALARLPLRQAEVLHLVFQQELSVSDAAGVMRISVGSARQHYERAKRRLRQELAPASPIPVCEDGL